MKNIKKYLFTLLISITAFLFGINYVNAQGDPGEILISKTAVKNDVTYGRSANVTLTVDANAFTTIDKTDVVLVLDRSSSMNGDSMKNTEKAAEDLIDMLLTEKTKSKVRVGIDWAVGMGDEREIGEIDGDGENGINCGRDVRPARLDHVNFLPLPSSLS